jgi:hypothetical protein
VGLIAVHRPSGVDTGDCPTAGALRRAMDRSGRGGQWVLLHTQVRRDVTGFVAPRMPAEWRGWPGVPDPLGWWTPREWPVDDQPVGVERV